MYRKGELSPAAVDRHWPYQVILPARDYAAIGTVSNVASRLCDEAKPGQILISPRVFTAVKDSVAVEPVGEFTLKGGGLQCTDRRFSVSCISAWPHKGSAANPKKTAKFMSGVVDIDRTSPHVR